MPRSLKKKSQRYSVKQLKYDETAACSKYTNPELKGSEDQNELLLAIQELSPRKVKVLLDRGVDPNFCFSYGNQDKLNVAAHQIPLHLVILAVSRRPSDSVREEITGLLLFFGADPNCKDRTGTPALHLACMHGYAGVTSLLLQSGADPRAVNDMNETALLFMCQGNFAKPKPVSLVSQLLTSGCPVNYTNHKQESALLVLAQQSTGATASGRAEMYRELVKQGANVHATNLKGKTALFYELQTVISDRWNPLDDLKYGSTVQALICAGAGLEGLQDLLMFESSLSVLPLLEVVKSLTFILSLAQLRQLLAVAERMQAFLLRWRHHNRIQAHAVGDWTDGRDAREEHVMQLTNWLRTRLASVLSLKQLARLVVRESIVSASRRRTISVAGDGARSGENLGKDPRTSQDCMTEATSSGVSQKESELHTEVQAKNLHLEEGEDTLEKANCGGDVEVGKRAKDRGREETLVVGVNDEKKRETLKHDVDQRSSTLMEDHKGLERDGCSEETERKKRRKRRKKGLKDAVCELPLPEIMKTYLVSCD